MAAASKLPLVMRPFNYSKQDIYAVRAFQDGKASEGQQKRIWELLIRITSMRDDVFVPGADDIRCYMLGRQSVGRELARMLTINTEKLTE